MSRSVTVCTAAVLALFSATVFAANPYPTVPLYLDQVTAKPNVAVLVDDSGSMVCQPSDTSGCSRNKSVSFVNNSTSYVAKMRLAKTALNSLFSNNFDIARWSLFKFRTIIPTTYTDGGYGISYTAGSSTLLADWNATNGLSDFTSAVNSLVPAGSTPSASAFYNVMQYFYGNSSYGANTYQSIRDTNNSNPYFWNSSAIANYSGSGQSYTSPIQYVCQKNFVIFVSDGQPNQENGDILTATATNPKDGQSYTISDYVNSKNLLTGYTSSVRNTTVVNYAAFYHDAGVVPNGKSKDNEGNSFDATTSPPITTYTIGLGLASGDTGRSVLQAMAEAGGGQYFDTSDQTSLTNALQSILNSIKTQTATNVPVVASKPTNPTDAIQATFYSGDWSGQLRAYSVSSTTGLANLNSPIPVLFNSSSATRLANIFTSTGGSASGALYTSVSSDSNLNSYLSGGSPSGWRSRSSDKSTPSTLGDIIDSTPTPFGTKATAGFAVGANDGMLHVFGRTTSNYTEVFSYIPRAVTAANLALLGSTTYGAAQPHLYFVNGNLTFNNVSGGDNQFSTSTTSVLTGGMAQGGQGLFALDISNTVGNPSLLTGGSVFGAGNVLWDHVPADSGFTNLGYTFAKPVIAQVYYGGNKKWAMITGNGYDSTNKATTLMVIDLLTGAMLYEINTGTASNGLSSPAVLDVNNDKVADYVYAGDQSGNVWRFKLQTSSSTTTSVSKFFTAQANQPIVAAPAIYAIPGGGYMVYIGTGRMMYENTSYNDRTTVYPQSLYGIYDDQTKTNLTYSSSTFITDGEVAKLNGTASIDGSATSTALGKLGSSVVFRKTTTISDAATTGGLSVGPSGNRAGWVFNMDSTNGERMIYQPVVALGKLYFTTQVLKGSSLVCSNVNQQSGWVMALDLMTGGTPTSPSFDLNGDGKINTSTASPDGDMVTDTDGKTKIVPSGINYNIGIPSALSIAFTVTTVNLGDYTSTDAGQLGSYPYPSSSNTNEVLTFYVGGTGGSNGNVAAGKLIPKASSVGRRIAWREIF